MRRLKFIDALRGLAVVGMLMIHLFEWWLRPSAKRTDLFAWLYFISKIVAPIFLMLVGVSLVLKIGQTTPSPRSYRAVVGRGVKILLTGYVFNLAVWASVWGLEEILVWDILQLIGVAILLCLVLLVTVPPIGRLLLALALIGLSSFLTERHLAFLPDYLAGIIAGTAPVIYFPLVPWLCYPLLGTVLGEGLVGARADGRQKRLWAICAILALALIVVGLAGKPYALPFDPQSLWETEFSHPPLTQISFALGAVLLLFAGLGWLYQRARGYLGFLEPLELMGRNALFIYILHHLIGYDGFYLLKRQNAFSFTASGFMVVLGYGLIYLLLHSQPRLMKRIHVFLD
ncbi:MAG TPA: DUF1624 domain-containing protein [Anaerolineae bacterium]|nr:DUF1624 domain-containing protein [Anaerolineae bacterium]